MAKEMELSLSIAPTVVRASATISLRLGAHAQAWYAMWLEPQLMQQLAALSKRHVEVLTAQGPAQCLTPSAVLASLLGVELQQALA